MSDRRAKLHEAMAGMAAGDRRALDTVYEMTSAKLYATIVRIVRTRDRSEDLLQDVYIRAWRSAARFDPDKSSAITWLCTIARNLSLNAVRDAGRHGTISDEEIPEIEDDAPQADEWLCNAEDAAAIRRCMDGLQNDHRRSIRLAFFEGYSHSELAERIDQPLGTVKSWIRRGLAGLKGCLGG